MIQVIRVSQSRYAAREDRRHMRKIALARRLRFMARAWRLNDD